MGREAEQPQPGGSQYQLFAQVGLSHIREESKTIVNQVTCPNGKNQKKQAGDDPSDKHENVNRDDA